MNRISAVRATLVDRYKRIAKCPCGETIWLPNEDCATVLRVTEVVWYPKLVAVRCSSCRVDVRLE